MSVHDYVLANQSGSSFRSDLNNALAAIVSQNSSSTEPATTYAYQYWVDTSATPALIKQRNAANDDWITLAEVDGQTLADDGTNAKPGISFAADINCGLKRNAADDISIVTGGTQAITVDSSQNVGVGTSNPSTKLQAVQNSGGTIAAFSYTNSTGGGAEIRVNNGYSSTVPVYGFWFNNSTGVGNPAANEFSVITAGSERMRIDSSGNVGIGTTSPSNLLHISDDGGDGILIERTGAPAKIQTNFGGGDAAFQYTVNNANSYIVGIDDSDGDKFKISYGSSDNAALGTNDYVVVNPSGNVGIGVNNPAQKLHVNGSIMTAEGTAASPALQIGDSDTGIFDAGANAIGFTTGGVERFRIDSSGDIFIKQFSTSSPGTGNTTVGAAFEQSTSGTRLYLSQNSTSVLHVNRNNNGNCVDFRRAGVQVGRVITNATSVSYSTNSDYRLKENVVVLDNSIDRVKQLQPKRFNFINDSLTVDGFLAHEAQTVVPEAVEGSHNETEPIGTLTEWDGTVIETDVVEPDELTWEDSVIDEDGNETVETRTRTWSETGTQPVYQSIDQSKFVPLLTAALKEAIAKIETLETKVAALEAAN